MSSLILHEIAHGVYKDHADVYRVSNNYLEKLLETVKTKSRFQVRGFTLEYVATLEGYLRQMQKEELFHRSAAGK